MADNYSQDGFSDGGDDVPVKVSPASFSHSESIFIYNFYRLTLATNVTLKRLKIGPKSKMEPPLRPRTMRQIFKKSIL